MALLYFHPEVFSQIFFCVFGRFVWRGSIGCSLAPREQPWGESNSFILPRGKPLSVLAVAGCTSHKCTHLEGRSVFVYNRWAGTQRRLLRFEVLDQTVLAACRFLPHRPPSAVKTVA